MDPATWKAARALFDELVDEDEATRATKLDATAPALAELVREMLELDVRAGESSFLGQNALPKRTTMRASLEGRAIGPFRVLRRIGQGGMGVVYEAEQAEPRRRVALKVLRPELVGGGVLRRFRVEAEILASLRHPGIAQVFASGTEAVGEGELRVELHWQALELLEGARPLARFADEERLDARERAALVARVADAVQHAHERGVIHRDLKPTNVLVDASGQPKVIDFGVARAAREDDASLVTTAGELLGTLRYMAPEQLAADPDAIGVRADVYALGVLLFELLCGRPPIEVAGLSQAEALRALAEREPARPRALRPALARELEWILFAALERDPLRRTPSAAALRDDLGRFLRGEAVEAGAPGRIYRLRKLAWRHRFAVGSAALVVASLGAGLVVAWRGLREARRSQVETQAALGRESQARRAAELESAKSSSVVDLVQFALDEARRSGGARDLRVSELFVSVSRALGMHAFVPEVEATVRNTIARFHLAVGNEREALDEAGRARAALESSGEGDSYEAMVAWTLAAHAGALLGRYDEAERAFERALALSELHPRDFPIDRLALRQRRLANWLELGRTDEAERELDALSQEVDSIYGADSKNAWALRGMRVEIALQRGDAAAAGALAERAIAWSQANGAEDYLPRQIELLAEARAAQGRFDEAARSFEDALARSDRRGGPGNANSARCASELARTLVALGRTDEAEAHARRAVDALRAQGAVGASLVDALGALAEAELARGELEDGRARMDEARALAVSSLPPRAPARRALEDAAARWSEALAPSAR